ncbi:MAG: hypothetical protein LBT62_00330 [Deltaproteobacteria bacterium]|jgi:hypothetical protein|nr:hypothetical protein [Deltaproteobacteria bacterium]
MTLKNFRISEKSVVTLVGKIRIRRNVLRPKTKTDIERLFKKEQLRSVVPLDEYLGLNRIPFKMTIGAMLLIAYWVQRSNSYEEAEEGLRRHTRIDVKNDTMRFVANTVGKIVFDNDAASAESAYAELNSGKLSFPAEKRDSELYLQCGGAMFHSRDRDENGHTWKENKLGVVFGGDSCFRWTNPKTGEREKRMGKREYIAYAGSVDIFQKLLFDAALKNGYGKYKTTILITDGASWIKDMKDSLFHDAICILDFFHLCENVHKFAEEYFNDNEDKYKTWSKDICDKLRASEYEDVINILQKLDGKRVANCSFKLLNYINDNIDCIDYKTYENNGWFIGSGAIESANKIVLQERLKQAGMRWNLETARYIMALTAKVKSKLWERDVMEAVYKHYGAARASAPEAESY